MAVFENGPWDYVNPILEKVHQPHQEKGGKNSKGCDIVNPASEEGPENLEESQEMNHVVVLKLWILDEDDTAWIVSAIVTHSRMLQLNTNPREKRKH